MICLLFYTVFSYLFMFGVYHSDCDLPLLSLLSAPLVFPVYLGMAVSDMRG